MSCLQRLGLAELLSLATSITPPPGSVKDSLLEDVVETETILDLKKHVKKHVMVRVRFTVQMRILTNNY